jgi:hypothetical protein
MYGKKACVSEMTTAASPYSKIPSGSETSGVASSAELISPWLPKSESQE